MRNGSKHRRQSGFTYILLLFVVAIAGVALAGAGQWWSLNSKREKETQLRFAGGQIAIALKSYADAGMRLNPPSTASVANSTSVPSARGRAYPHRLEELLEDRRFEPAMRHLRRLYFDPMTGAADWVPIREGTTIVGVHSRSQATPLGTSAEKEKHAGKYSDWEFRAADAENAN